VCDEDDYFQLYRHCVCLSSAGSTNSDDSSITSVGGADANNKYDTVTAVRSGLRYIDHGSLDADRLKHPKRDDIYAKCREHDSVRFTDVISDAWIDTDIKFTGRWFTGRCRNDFTRRCRNALARRCHNAQPYGFAVERYGAGNFGRTAGFDASVLECSTERSDNAPELARIGNDLAFRNAADRCESGDCGNGVTSDDDDE
jgi:hypothetical protein